MPKALSPVSGVLGESPAHLTDVSAPSLPPTSQLTPADPQGSSWLAFLGAYAIPLVACAVLLLLCYRYRTSTRAPDGLRRAARFEGWSDRVLLIDALLVALGTPLVLGLGVALWFLPLRLPFTSPESIHAVTVALAVCGATVAAGWLAPDSLFRLGASLVTLVLAVQLSFLPPSERFAIAIVPLVALLWFAFVFPFAHASRPHRLRFSALLGALLLFLVSSAPAVCLRWDSAEAPLVAKPMQKR